MQTVKGYNVAQVYHHYHHSYHVGITSGPQPISKQVLQRVRSSASSFSIVSTSVLFLKVIEHLFTSSFSSSLHFYLFFNNVLQKAVATQYVTIPANHSSFCQVRMQNCEKLLLASSCMPVCLSVRPSAWNNSAPTGRIFMKFSF